MQVGLLVDSRITGWARGFSVGEGVSGTLLLLPDLPAANTVAEEKTKLLINWLPGL